MHMEPGPTQNNLVDCGVFTCMAMEYASRGALHEYTKLKSIQKTDEMKKKIEAFRYKMLLELKNNGKVDFGEYSDDLLIDAGEKCLREHKKELAEADAIRQTPEGSDERPSSTPRHTQPPPEDGQVFSLYLRNQPLFFLKWKIPFIYRNQNSGPLRLEKSLRNM